MNSKNKIKKTLKFLIASFSSGSSFFLPVTPIIDGSKCERNFLILSGSSLSGSTDTNTVFNLINFPSGKFLILCNAFVILYKL